MRGGDSDGWQDRRRWPHGLSSASGPSCWYWSFDHAIGALQRERQRGYDVRRRRCREQPVSVASSPWRSRLTAGSSKSAMRLSPGYDGLPGDNPKEIPTSRSAKVASRLFDLVRIGANLGRNVAGYSNGALALSL